MFVEFTNGVSGVQVNVEHPVLRVTGKAFADFCDVNMPSYQHDHAG